MVTIPAFKLPSLVSQIGTRLPQWPHSVGLASMLNLAKLLRLLPDDSLDEMEGRVFRVSVSDTGGTAQFTYGAGRFRPVFRPDAAPDLSFTADLAAYLQLVARQEDPDTLFFNRRLLIEGDTELGLVVKNMLDAIDWSHLPIPARFKHVA